MEKGKDAIPSKFIAGLTLLLLLVIGAFWVQAGGMVVHAIRIIEGTSQPFKGDSVLFGQITGQTYSGATGTGASITSSSAAITLPMPYNVQVTGSDPQAHYVVSAKTGTGFVVTVSPLGATTSLGPGTFDVLITR